MRTFVAIALIGLASVVKSDHPHYLFLKNFEDGLQECAEMLEMSSCDLKQHVADSFPDKPEVWRLMRCTLLNLKCWNDATGVVHHQMSAFFQPSPSDPCHENRTKVCLNSVPERVDPTDFFRSAYESFQCYYRCYGDLVESAQFLQNLDLELEQVLMATADYLQLDEETFIDFCKGNFANNDRAREVLYVINVRAGYFVPNKGFQLERLYRQFGNEEVLSTETQQCVDKVAAEYCGADDSEQNYQICVQCLRSLEPVNKLMKAFSKKRVSDPEVCDCSSPQVQVYNV